MAQDDSLVIDWQGEEKDRIGNLVCTLEVDQDGLADFETELTKALSNIDPATMEGIQEMSRAVSEIAESGARVSLDMYASLRPVCEQYVGAIQRAAECIADFWRPIVDSVTEYWRGILDIYERYHDCEPAYREYVVKLNWKRGRGKKLSWRSLNRQQRRDAISEYLAKHGPMSL